MPHADIEARRKYHREYKNRRYREDAAFRENIRTWRKGRQRGYWLMHKYGITESEYAGMVEAQNGLCYLCGKDDPKLHVDHSHDTGKIRGLLCMLCNTTLGRIEKIGIDKVSKYVKEKA